MNKQKGFSLIAVLLIIDTLLLTAGEWWCGSNFMKKKYIFIDQ